MAHQSTIGIVGIGYWGKIILRNLRQLGYKNITVCEERDIDWHDIGQKYPHVTNYKNLQCDKVFIVVPVTTHYTICRYFLEKGIDVFCEKPLDTDVKKCQTLFKIAKKNKANLFVDWLFMFNPAVIQIKTLINSLGAPKNIIANRMNFGPVREDTNARWDLASHDVSIACYLLEEQPKNVQWLDLKRIGKSKQSDSTVGVLEFSQTNVQINASWSYGMKNRMYILEFENSFLHWDDNTGTILYGSETLPLEQTSSLHSSIKTFFSNDFDQENLTINITKILQKVNTV